MSKYTTQLRYIMENYCILNNKKHDTVDAVIANSRDYIFSFNIDLPDPFKEDFINTFLRYYYMEEIGQETAAAFKLRLEVRCRLLTDKYKGIIEHYTDYLNSSYIRLTEGSTNTEANSTGTSQVDTQHRYEIWKENKLRYSDTPQGRLGDIDSNTYLTSANLDSYYDKLAEVNHDNGKTTSKDQGSQKDKGKETFTDFDTLIKRATELKGSILTRMIEECSNLFMIIY